jgi:elongation factor P
MKIAQEIRSGNVMMVGKEAFVVLKADFSKSGRNASVVKMKLKNLLSGSAQESVYRADEKFEMVNLERKDVTYSYFAEPSYVFMDEEFHQYEIDAENMGDALDYLEDGMPALLVIYQDRPIAVEIPQTVVREIAHTEPAVRGDSSGKVLKPAKLKTGFEIQVPLFCDTGTKIEIDTRTGEYRNRAKG